MPSLGERFRTAREARGLSLSDVAEQIRIRSVYLGAIEDENWSAIGAAVYSRGFLRTYARFLGLDPEEVVSEFNAGLDAVPAALAGAPESSRRQNSMADRPARNLSPFIWAASIVAVLLVAFVFYNELSMRKRAPAPGAEVSASTTALPSDASSAVAGNATSVSTPVASPLKAAGTHSIEVSLTKASWLRIVVDGNVSMEGTFPAGTVKVFRGDRAALRVGNAGGVVVFVDGKSVGKLGADGAVIERSFAL